MFDVKNLSIIVNGRYLVENLSFTLNKGDKLAIIGEEGNGKSTLLKTLLGKCDYATITGNINRKNISIGYLEQTLNEIVLDKSVHDFLFESTDEYYNKINDLYKYADTLNINESLFNQALQTLSGGEKVKVRILKLLLSEADVLLLDEPTNDLDLETLDWLEKFICNSNKPIMYVSHDETLLSNTANMILHLEQIKSKTECRHTILRIDYDTYVEERLRKITKQTQVANSEKREFNKKQEKLRQVTQKVEYQQNTISRGDPHGARLLKKKMHSLKAQEKKLDDITLTELPDVEESIRFEFTNVFLPRTKNILNLNIPELKIQNKVLAHNIKLDVVGNEHVCIIGHNGCGKTTLIKYIYNELKNRDDIKLGYMSQDYEESLKDFDTVLDYIAVNKNKEEITNIRSWLGNMKFTRNEMTGKIADLSNGSKAKLILLKLVFDNCNVLLLDEPTRNVSPLSNPVIREVLKKFNGAIISVSHDRKYIQEVANKVYLLTENGLTEQFLNNNI